MKIHPGAPGPLRLDRISFTQAGRQEALSRRVSTGGALLQSAADNHVIDLAWLNARTGHGMLNGMAGHDRTFRVVKGATIGFANRRAGGGNNDGFSHGDLLVCLWAVLFFLICSAAAI